MHNTKALLLNVSQCLIYVVNTLRFYCYAVKILVYFIFEIHKNDVKTKPGYKTELKDAKTFKWRILMRRKNLFLTTRTCRHAQVLVWFSCENVTL